MKTFKAALSLLLISSVSAIAADLPSIKSAPVTAPAPMWTGFYAGLNAGGTWANNSTANVQTWNLSSYEGSVSNGNLASAALFSGSGTNSSNSGGFIGGGQIGYNWQVSGSRPGWNLVTGVEADIEGIAGSAGTANRRNGVPTDDGANPVSLLSNQSAQSNLQYLGTVRGRLGILAKPALLIYGTGGLAYGGVSASIQNTQFWLAPTCGCDYLIFGNGSTSNTQVGWTAGGGFEWLFMPNWSLKTEYLYYDLGNIAGSFVNTYAGFNQASGDSGIQSLTNYSGRITGNIVRAGVNYHFNLASTPVGAKF
jgi:outer membrane immunogenic protein